MKLLKKKDLAADLSWWKKVLSNLRMGGLRLLSIRDKKKQEKEKSAECQRSVEGYQRQHIDVESLKNEENRQKEYMKK